MKLSIRWTLYYSLCALSLLGAAGCATTSEPVSRNPEMMAKEAEAFQSSRRYEDAIAQWKKVKDSYASPEMTALAEIKIADAQFDNGNFIEAAASYEEFRKLHPNNEKSAYALYRQALSYYNQITGIDTDQTPVTNAVAFFESFLKLYPTSEYAQEVRNKLEVCRMKQVEYEIYVGRFYYRTEKYASAIKRLEEALTKYPRSPLHDETLYFLGKSYVLAGDRAKGREAFQRLFNEYRTSKYVDEAREFLDKNY
ncbi:outer membrane protein assembly factor BamD [Geobacter sp.]|uniref:outer membrane protein assembly factor BamD n=2 Tax=Geobacter sp. TaxID=46610 RepID=UPI00262D5F33|nr:outer membrane protein assembly factor BamD [Geobacter sp.]